MSKKEISFTEGPVFQSLLRFAIPVLGALILQAAYGAVDLLIVGKFGNASSISAVGTGSSFMQMATFIITSLAMGSTVIIGHHIGPLGQGVGVCEGIAKAVKVLLDALGVWCVIAICGNNPEKGIKYRHTWNIVKIGGTYYHLDATFDNTLGKDRETSEIRYDYFNLDDSQIFRDHEPLIAPAPHCGDHEHFYYKEKKLSFTKKEDVYKRSLQAAKKGRVLIFHWRGGYLTKEVLKELLELIRKAGDEKDKTAMVSINWPQAVIRVQYTDMQVQESVTIEEANEGEK